MNWSELQQAMDKTQRVIIVEKPYSEEYDAKVRAYITKHNLILVYVRFSDGYRWWHRLNNGGGQIEQANISKEYLNSSLNYYAYPLQTMIYQPGHANKFLKIGESGKLEYVDAPSGSGLSGGSGATTFLALNDTPSSYTAGKILAVNSSGNGLGFVDMPQNKAFTNEQIRALTKEQVDELMRVYSEIFKGQMPQAMNSVQSDVLSLVATPEKIKEIQDNVTATWKNNLKDEIKAELLASITDELATAVLAKMAKDGNNVLYNPTINMANVKLVQNGAEVNVALEQDASGKLVGKNIDINGAFSIEISKV